MSETHTTNRGLEKYFGPGAPFSEASYLVHMNELPPEILAHSETLGDSRIAFRLGWAFASVLKQRSMRITRDDLQQIGWIKIVTGLPAEFEKGFAAFQAEDRA
jgi:hypothetical protein